MEHGTPDLLPHEQVVVERYLQYLAAQCKNRHPYRRVGKRALLSRVRSRAIGDLDLHVDLIAYTLDFKVKILVGWNE